MNEPIDRYFKVGTIHFMSYPEVMRGTGPVLETLKKILADDTFDAVEVTWIKDKETRQKAKEMLACAGVTVCYGAQPRLLTTGLNPNDLDEDGRQAAEATLIEAVDEAAYLGAGSIAFMAGHYDPARLEEGYAQLCKTTRALCAYAQTKGMAVNLEVFDYDVDKRSLIGPAPLAARLAAEIRGLFPHFGLLVDLSHIPQTHETSEVVIATLAPYIRHLHIGNAVLGDPSYEAYGDTHPRFGFPHSVNGVAQLTDFLRAVQGAGLFDQSNPLVLSFEVKPWKDEDADLVLAGAKRVLREAWHKV